MFYKKGAMFGLDARIALAIFGALSVISGAALFSAIKQAKITTLVTELNEVIKAVEAYALDTGTLMPIVAHSMFTANELVTSVVPGWKGPYISADIVNHSSYCSNCAIKKEKYNYHASNDAYIVISGNKDNQSSSYAWNFDSCTSGTGCTVWVQLLYQDPALVKAFDEKVDGVYNVGKGKVRMSSWSGDIYHIYYNTGISIDQF